MKLKTGKLIRRVPNLPLPTDTSCPCPFVRSLEMKQIDSRLGTSTEKREIKINVVF